MRTLLLVFIMVFGSCFLLSYAAFAAPKTNLEKVMSQAQEKERGGDYEGAQSLYEGILHHHPNYEPALLGLAQVRYWQGNYEASVETYSKILEKDSDHVKALVGTGKAYLAMGKQRKAQEFFNKAEKIEPTNEETQAVKPQLEKKTRLVVRGGYITENLSYAPETQGEFQEIRVTKEKTYGFGLNTTYIQKFNRDAFDTKLFGHYYILQNTRADLAISFAPKVNILPRQSYEVGLAHTIWKITPEAHYLFQDYAQANLHTIRPALFFEPVEFIRIGGGYELQNLKFGTTSRNFHGGFAQVRLTPIEWLSIHGFYSRIQRGFEPGRSTPFINYKAHVGGGGIAFDFLAAYTVGFDARLEDRNNGETASVYTLSAGYSF